MTTSTTDEGKATDGLPPEMLTEEYRVERFLRSFAAQCSGVATLTGKDLTILVGLIDAARAERDAERAKVAELARALNAEQEAHTASHSDWRECGELLAATRAERDAAFAAGRAEGIEVAQKAALWAIESTGHGGWGIVATNVSEALARLLPSPAVGEKEGEAETCPHCRRRAITLAAAEQERDRLLWALDWYDTFDPEAVEQIREAAQRRALLAAAEGMEKK